MIRKIERNIKRFLSKKITGAALAAFLITGSPAAEAYGGEQIYLEANQNYHLYPRSEALTVVRVAVTNPTIADVRVIDDTSLNIVGYKGGSTSITVWYSDGSVEDYTVVVSPTDAGFTELMRRVMNVRGVQVEKIGDKVLLRGSVENQYQMNQALRIAETFADKEHVVNLLQMTKPVQINLAALVIDISASGAKEIGLSFGNSSVDSSSGGSVSVSDITFGTIGTFYGGQNYHNISGKYYAPVDVMLRALITNGKAEILSRPNITTMSGEKANILIGGEIPVPTSKDGEISVEWREYGIKLIIEPTTDEDNTITARVNAEISTLDYAHQISTSAGKIPALTSRKAGTCVSLKSGSALAIGGLLNSEDAKTETKIPLLGDIPVIGHFFRNTTTSKEKREMMIILIPTIVDEMTPVPTTDKMAGVINKEKYERENMTQVDINAPAVAPPDKKKKKKAEPEEQEEKAEVREPRQHYDTSLNRRLQAILHSDKEEAQPAAVTEQPKEQPKEEVQAEPKKGAAASEPETAKSGLNERLQAILHSDKEEAQPAAVTEQPKEQPKEEVQAAPKKSAAASEPEAAKGGLNERLQAILHSNKEEAQPAAVVEQPKEAVQAAPEKSAAASVPETAKEKQPDRQPLIIPGRPQDRLAANLRAGEAGTAQPAKAVQAPQKEAAAAKKANDSKDGTNSGKRKLVVLPGSPKDRAAISQQARFDYQLQKWQEKQEQQKQSAPAADNSASVKERKPLIVPGRPQDRLRGRQ